MAQIIAALKNLGINDEQIGTSNYSVYPVYGQVEPLAVCIQVYPPPHECQPRQEIVGYKAVNNITVTLDVDGDVNAGQVIDTAVEAGPTMSMARTSSFRRKDRKKSATA